MNDSFNGKNGKVKVMYVRSEDDSKDRDQKSRPEGKGRQGERGGRQGRSAQDGQACRYATHLIALRDGKIVAEGAPKEIVNAALIEKIYGLRCTIIDDPVAHTPLVVPLGRK